MSDLLHALAPVVGTLLGWLGRTFVEARSWRAIQAAARAAAESQGTTDEIRRAAEQALLQSQLDKLASAAAKAAAVFPQSKRNGAHE